MDIIRNQLDGHLEIRISGRLDAYWADHLSAALEEELRRGADHIRLDMGEIVYMSSVGIRVLLRFYKQLERLNGSFAVIRPSAAVQGVLELAGLQSLLFSAAAEAAEQAVHAGETALRVEHGGALFDVFDLAPGATIEARVLGEAGAMVGGSIASAPCHTLRATESLFALGLGAFGRDFDDCRGRFGEFIAAAGAAAYLPADGTNVADALVATGAFVPELRVLHAIACEGTFARLARFEVPGRTGASLAAEHFAPVRATADVGRVKLETLAEACLSLVDSEAAAIVMVAETAGLMGAALRRSPASGDAPFAFELPQLREWLWFTPERAFARSLALVVGVATRGGGALAPHVRPLGAASSLAGHFHAAAFSYRPLRKGRIDLRSTAASLFEAEHLQGVLHLLNDDRAIVGGGQSEFVRGACWIGPLGRVSSEVR